MSDLKINCEICGLEKETKKFHDNFRICKECIKDSCEFCNNKDKSNMKGNPICSECIDLSKFKGSDNFEYF